MSLWSALLSKFVFFVVDVVIGVYDIFVVVVDDDDDDVDVDVDVDAPVTVALAVDDEYNIADDNEKHSKDYSDSFGYCDYYSENEMMNVHGFVVAVVAVAVVNVDVVDSYSWFDSDNNSVAAVVVVAVVAAAAVADNYHRPLVQLAKKDDYDQENRVDWSWYLYLYWKW